MDINKLKMFVALSETLHFNQAAEKCHVSPSTFSRCIQHIEQHMNVRLFDRDNRSVHITTAGKRFLQFARETLQQWESLQHSIMVDTGQLQGSISLFCSVTASYSFLYDILTDFRRKHPLIEIKLHTGDPASAIDRTVNGYEDIAIAARHEPMPQSVQFKRIAFSPLVLIQPLNSNWFPHAIEDTPAFWSTVPFILSERGVVREQLDDWFRANQVTPQIYAQVAGHEAIVSMVSLGFGLGLIPKIVLDNSPLLNKVKPLPFQPTLKPHEVGLCILTRKLRNPLMRAFWEQIKEEQ